MRRTSRSVSKNLYKKDYHLIIYLSLLWYLELRRGQSGSPNAPDATRSGAGYRSIQIAQNQAQKQVKPENRRYKRISHMQTYTSKPSTEDNVKKLVKLLK